MDQRPVDTQFQRVGIGKVGDADHPAADLVLIARPDAAPGGADLGDTRLRLARAVKLAVEGHDERSVFGDHQRLWRDLHPLRADRGDLLDQMPGVKDDAIADHRKFAAPHHARGQRVQLVDLAADDKRMARIMPALKPRDDIGAFRKPVDDLALALVPPLGAHNHDIGHPSCSLCGKRGRYSGRPGGRKPDFRGGGMARGGSLAIGQC